MINEGNGEDIGAAAVVAPYKSERYFSNFNTYRSVLLVNIADEIFAGIVVKTATPCRSCLPQVSMALKAWKFNGCGDHCSNIFRENVESKTNRSTYYLLQLFFKAIFKF